MRKLFRVYNFLSLLFILMIALYTGACSIHYGIMNKKAKKQLREVPILSEGGYSFRDLNKNGRLDVYEDSLQKTDLRKNDLISLMTLEEKAGMLWQPPIGVDQFGGNDNVEDLVELENERQISEMRIDESVRRLLKISIRMLQEIMLNSLKNLVKRISAFSG